MSLCKKNSISSIFMDEVVLTVFCLWADDENKLEESTHAWYILATHDQVLEGHISKSWMQNSANYFELPSKQLAQNAEFIKFSRNQHYHFMINHSLNITTTKNNELDKRNIRIFMSCALLTQNYTKMSRSRLFWKVAVFRIRSFVLVDDWRIMLSNKQKRHHRCM